MKLCKVCKKKEVAAKTWWERIRAKAFQVFGTDIVDLGADKFTEGFGEGYRKGWDHSAQISKDERHLTDAVDGLVRSWERKISLETIVDPLKFLQLEGNIVTLAGEKITKETLLQLKGECDLLQKSKIWGILQETIKQKAIEKSILKSTDFQQVIAGKMMLHNLGIMKSIVDVIIKTKIPE